MRPVSPGQVRLVAALLLFLLASVVSAQSLRVWTTLEGPPLDWLRLQAQTFSEGMGIEVEIEEHTLGELKELAVALAAEGEAADLFVGVPHTQLTEMAAEGILADLHRYATPSYLEDLSGPARASFERDGTLLGLPMWIEGPALIVNRDLMPSVPDEYGEFISLAARITSPEVYGFAFDVENLYYSYAWFDTFGGYLFGSDGEGRPDPSLVGLSTPESVRAAFELRALRFEHELLPAETGFGNAARLFLDGRLAATFDGPWAAAAFKNAGIDIEVRPMPALHGEESWSAFVGATGVLLNANGENRGRAVNLAKWLVRSEAQVELARQAFRIPASLSAAHDVDDPLVSGFSRALSTGTPLPGIPEMGDVWQPAGQALSRIMHDPDADVEAALQQAAEAIRPHQTP